MMIQRLPMDQLKPGMVVASPVTTPDGRTLCAAGAKLSEQSLRRLRGMGVEWVGVLSRGTEETAGAPDLVRRRFRRAVNDPAMAALCEIVVESLSPPTPPEKSLAAPATWAATVVQSPERGGEEFADRFARVSRWFRQATGRVGGADDGRG